MNERTAFSVVLVYDDGGGRYSADPHVISAAHPEIAYRIALARGAEQRYGRRFVGLAALEEDDGEHEHVAVSRGGDAHEHVVPKYRLAAFADGRWADVPCSNAEIAAALREPPALVELPGLDDVPWHELTHAYGVATDVPIDLRRAASSDAERRAEAIWQLGGSIHHQGTLYPATAHAIPFLIRLVSEVVLPQRAELAGLLAAIAESCAVDPDVVHRAWAWRKESFGEIYDAPAEELAERELRTRRASREALLAHEEQLLRLAADPDPEVARIGAEIVANLELSRS